MEQIRINYKKLLSDETYRLEEVSFTKPALSGEPHEQTNEVYFRPDAAAVLLVDLKKEEFVLAKQMRLPVFINPHDDTEGYLLEACAGLIEEGESPGSTVIREADEELGYEIADPLRIGGVYTSAGGITEYVHLFIAEIDEYNHKSNGGGASGEGEDIKVVKLKFDVARKCLLDGSINDAKTMLLLQHYLLNQGKPQSV